MTKLFKKSLALLLTLALCLSAMACCFFVSAEGETTPAGSISFVLANGTTEINPGDDVIIDVVANWSGVAGAEFTVTGIPAEAEVKTTNTEVVINHDAAAATVKFVDGNNGELANGVLFSISFTAGEAATLYNLAFADNSVFCNLNEEDVTVTCVPNSFEVVEKAPEHTHNYVATVTTQPTKDAEGVMTYTCDCGEGTYTEAIAKPVALGTKTLVNQIFVAESVGNRIKVNYQGNTQSVIGLGYSDYFVVVDYKKYASEGGKSYAKFEDKQAIYTADKKVEGAGESTANMHVFKFSDIALYEMPLTFTTTVYMLDNNGVVAAYVTSDNSIADQALALAQSSLAAGDAKSMKNLKSVVDMVVFASTAQEFFASQNKGSLIDGAELPNAKFSEELLSYASKDSELPESFNTTRVATKHVADTKLNISSTLITSSSNIIRYSFLTNGYDADKLVAEISYVNAYGRTVTDTVNFSELEVPAANDKGQIIYKYDFTALALYDLDETVTVTLKYEGNDHISLDYSAGYYINANFSNANLKPVFTKMELFAQSTRVAFVGA